MVGYLEFHDDHCCAMSADIVNPGDRSDGQSVTPTLTWAAGERRDAGLIFGSGVDESDLQHHRVQPEWSDRRDVGDDG